ncbi:hypothetical protein EJ07DRAFT_153770 [Lizonia empirigonia]|nr:hypothetical protein EJ07DRAFT_153770 [Lizonia empirigonia]
MNRLKSKASRFFKDAPSQNENAANASAECGTEFDAGIERGVRRKASRFFQGRSERQSPSPSADVSPLGVSRGRPDVSAREGGARGGGEEDALEAMAGEIGKHLPLTPVDQDTPAPDSAVSEIEKPHGAARKAEPADLVLKSRPSFKALRSSSSRIFRSKPRTHSPPPPTPPLPQLPTTPALKPRRPTLRPPELTRSSKSKSTSKLSISRPISTDAALPAPVSPCTLPFTKPNGPPPPRPPRPETVDVELVGMRRSAGGSGVLYGQRQRRVRCGSSANSATTNNTTTNNTTTNNTTTNNTTTNNTTTTTPSSPLRSIPRTLSNPTSASPSPRLDLSARPTTHPPPPPLPLPFSLAPTQRPRPVPARCARRSLAAFAGAVWRRRGWRRGCGVTGRVRSYGFAAWVEARGFYCFGEGGGGGGGGGGGDGGGVDRDGGGNGGGWNGPIEAYDHSGADWVVERRVSAGPGGARGMLWRERGGAWCFVPDL